MGSGDQTYALMLKRQALPDEAVSLSLLNLFLCINLTNENQKRFRDAKTSTTNQNNGKTLIFIHSALKLF